MPRQLPRSLLPQQLPKQLPQPHEFNPAYIWVDIDEGNWGSNGAKALLRNNPNMRDQAGMSVLERAVTNGDIDLVEYLINETRVNVNAKCTGKTQLTEKAVIDGNAEVLAMLLYGDAPSDYHSLCELNVLHNLEPGLYQEIQEVIDRGGY